MFFPEKKREKGCEAKKSISAKLFLSFPHITRQNCCGSRHITVLMCFDKRTHFSSVYGKGVGGTQYAHAFPEKRKNRNGRVAFQVI